MPTRYAQDRSLTAAVAISALLHALILVVRPWATDSEQVGALPDLRVFIEQPASEEVDDDVLAATKRPAAVSNLLATTAAASRAEQPTADIEPQHRQEPAIEPLPIAEEAAALVAESLLPSASTKTEVTPDNFVTTTSASAETVAVSAPVEISAPAVSVASRRKVPEMTDGERHMLAKQFDKLARHMTIGAQVPEQRSWKYQDREHSVAVRRLPAIDDMAIERVEVEITTEENGVQLRSRAQLKRLAFSHFTQLVDEWDPGVQLHNDEIMGRFHSNSELVLGWDKAAVPRFLGQVTTAAHGFKIATAASNHARSDIFRGGIETGAHRIFLPTSSPSLGAAAPRKNSVVHLLDHDTRIAFYADGSFGMRAADSRGPLQHEALPATQSYFVGRSGVTIYVQGTVRGTILVYSPKHIVITGNLRYARDPRSGDASDDYLGLVAEEDIVVADSVVTGPGDLEIDAALYARRRFVVNDADRNERATLNIYGSLTAGTMSETEPRFATKVAFDPRFERVRPPGFPMTDRYEVTDWTQQWLPADH